jgi:predicted HTH transcriptional regulator
MELTNYLQQEEGKTLEFKENCYSLKNIIKTVIAFANTSGGTLLIGISDNKEVVGIDEPLKDEQRLSSAFADSIKPLLIPDISIITYRERSVIVICVHHSFAPFYLASEGLEKGVYIRLGSTNRQADLDTIESIRRWARNTAYDELPCPDLNSEAIDFRVASELFSKRSRTIDNKALLALGIFTKQGKTVVPTIGGVLLFGSDRKRIFPDAIIRCARFEGISKTRFIDQLDIDVNLPESVESVIQFIRKHILVGLSIEGIHSYELPQYPLKAIREAVINAIVHADYSIKGMNIRISIYDDRIEVTNPGLLPFGMSVESALSGMSKLRNRVIGRVFKELSLIEQWGTGIARIVEECDAAHLRPPRFEEIGTAFRVTLYAGKKIDLKLDKLEVQLVEYLKLKNEILTKEAADLWEVSERTARSRLLKMIDKGLISEVKTSPTDPKKVYVLKNRSSHV